MSRRLLILILLLPVTVLGGVRRHVVASGGSGDGSKDGTDSANAWTMTYAFASSNTYRSAGDTLMFHAGNYVNNSYQQIYVDEGTEGSPVVITQHGYLNPGACGEAVFQGGGWQIDSKHDLIIKGFHFAQTDTGGAEAQIYIMGDFYRVSVINCIFKYSHFIHLSYQADSNAGGDIYGNIFIHGGTRPDPTHNLYTQQFHEDGRRVHISNNFLMYAGNHGMQIYGHEVGGDYYDVDSNIIVNNSGAGIYYGTNQGNYDTWITRNVGYHQTAKVAVRAAGEGWPGAKNQYWDTLRVMYNDFEHHGGFDLPSTWINAIVKKNRWGKGTGVMFTGHIDTAITWDHWITLDSNYYWKRTPSTYYAIEFHRSDDTYTLENDLASWQTTSKKDSNSEWVESATYPGIKRTYVFPNKYEAGRAQVALFSDGTFDTIKFLPTTLTNGQTYYLYNTQNLFADSPQSAVWHTGDSIAVEMDSTRWTQQSRPYQPVYPRQYANTMPYFGAFLLTTRQIPGALPAGEGTSVPQSYFVAPNGGGSANNGSIGEPWRITYVIDYDSAQSAGKFKAGDTLWLRGGRYFDSGYVPHKFGEWWIWAEISIKGTPDKPIILRNYNDERVIWTVDSTWWDDGWDTTSTIHTLVDSADYVWLWGIEWFGNTTNKDNTDGNATAIDGISIAPDGSATTGFKLINCIFHDMWGATFPNGQAYDLEMYGNLMYFNGGVAAGGGGGTSHNIYAQSGGVYRWYTNNILWSPFALNMQQYSATGYAPGDSSNFSKNIVFTTPGWGDGRILFGKGTGDGVCTDSVRLDTIDQNYCFGIQFEGGYYQHFFKCRVTNNIFADTVNPGYNSRLQLLEPQSTTVTNNYIFGNITRVDCSLLDYNADADYPSNTFTETWPTSGDTSFCTKNTYEPTRAHIAVYNWDSGDSVDVTVSSVYSNGDTVSVYNAENYFGDTPFEGVVAAGVLRIPMRDDRWSVATPDQNPWSAPVDTYPKFGAFITKLGGEGAGETPTFRKRPLTKSRRY